MDGSQSPPAYDTSRSPYDIAPCSARKVGATFSANRSGDAWAVYQNTTWKDRDGWDGDCTKLADGLSETDARALAAHLTQEAEVEAAVAPLARSSTAAAQRILQGAL